MAGGRPTTYDPAFCEKIEELLAAGKSLTVAAGEIGIHRDTAYEWAATHEAFSDAVKRGRARGMAVWEQRLADLVTGEKSGNATALIFAMKNLYRDDWNDRSSVDHTSSDGSMTPQPTRIELAAAVKP